MWPSEHSRPRHLRIHFTTALYHQKPGMFFGPDERFEVVLGPSIPPNPPGSPKKKNWIKMHLACRSKGEMLCSYVYFKCIFCLINCLPRSEAKQKGGRAVGRRNRNGRPGRHKYGSGSAKCINVRAPRDPSIVPSSHRPTITGYMQSKSLAPGRPTTCRRLPGRRGLRRQNMKVLNGQGTPAMWGWLVTTIWPLAHWLLPLPLPLPGILDASTPGELNQIIYSISE